MTTKRYQHIQTMKTRLSCVEQGSDISIPLSRLCIEELSNNHDEIYVNYIHKWAELAIKYNMPNMDWPDVKEENEKFDAQ